MPFARLDVVDALRLILASSFGSGGSRLGHPQRPAPIAPDQWRAQVCCGPRDIGTLWQAVQLIDSLRLTVVS